MAIEDDACLARVRVRVRVRARVRARVRVRVRVRVRARRTRWPSRRTRAERSTSSQCIAGSKEYCLSTSVRHRAFEPPKYPTRESTWLG